MSYSIIFIVSLAAGLLFGILIGAHIILLGIREEYVLDTQSDKKIGQGYFIIYPRKKVIWNMITKLPKNYQDVIYKAKDGKVYSGYYDADQKMILDQDGATGHDIEDIEKWFDLEMAYNLCCDKLDNS